MSSRLLARLERLRPRQLSRLAVEARPGDSDMDIEIKVLAASRPVIVAPLPCRSSEEWLLTYAPMRGTA